MIVKTGCETDGVLHSTRDNSELWITGAMLGRTLPPSSPAATSPPLRDTLVTSPPAAHTPSVVKVRGQECEAQSREPVTW